jgi:hypothetical protein
MRLTPLVHLLTVYCRCIGGAAGRHDASAGAGAARSSLLLKDSNADDVEYSALHVSLKSDMVGVLSADNIRILDAD